MSFFSLSSLSFFLYLLFPFLSFGGGGGSSQLIWELLAKSPPLSPIKNEHVPEMSQLTNHKIYLELVNWNEVLKTMLTGPTNLSLPSPHVVFLQLFLIHFPYYL